MNDPRNLVLVFTGLEAEAVAWVDPRPLETDANGHVWEWDAVEPWHPERCHMCSTHRGEPGENAPCPEPELLADIQAERAEWIATHRVAEEASA